MTRLGTAVLLALAATSFASPAPAASTNGTASDMPAYYDHQLFTINFMSLAGTATTNLFRANGSINTIYTDFAERVGGQPFVSVLDAIQGDGFNPLWQEVEVRFTAGHAPRQLFSDNEVLAAAAAGEVTLHPSGEIYRCSVVGMKPAAAAGISTPRAAPAGTAGARAAAPFAAGAAQTPATWGAIKALYRH
ncbi:MAG TPA: hypothetical protein VGU27_02215 [Candidatus Eisenbacteria bacterium]|nr:hypothetical protein [Candidatus Eisenbacteria bacterium]